MIINHVSFLDNFVQDNFVLKASKDSPVKDRVVFVPIDIEKNRKMPPYKSDQAVAI